MSSEKTKKPIKVEIGMEFLKKQLMKDVKFEMEQLGVGDFEINITE